MSNIVRILESVTSNTLVLLDELGAGTDPTEGAALAISILEFLRERNIRSAITTHYSELKLFALSTPGAENASCEFDVETLRPTYKLLIGIPGKSNAFAIAARLGLPASVISHAKDVLSQEDVRFEDMITDLEISKKTVIMEQERAEQFRREAEFLKKEFEKQQNKLTEQKERILREAREEAARTVRDAREEADALIKEFRRQMKEQSDQRVLEEAGQQMRDGLTSMEGLLIPVTGAGKPHRTPPENLQRGDRVFIHSLNHFGTVSAVPDGNGEVQIQAGIMKIKVHVSDLSLDDSEEKAKLKQYTASVKSAKSMNIRQEVDLRGMMTEEAAEAADKYLDDAYLAGLETVYIIHGKGTGALRKAVHGQLKKHPHVKEYRLGKYGEGEDGVTVVSLK
jgi:DNA mismatch repair protein MutS2